MEDWALIRRLAGEGVPHAAIARRLGISRTTVVKAVASTAPPVYVRRPSETSFVVVEPRVKALLAATSDMPATVLAERVGWTGSITWFRESGARLRPEQRQLAHDHRPAHVTTAARLRQQFQQPRPAIDPVDDLVRDLADYDKAFGLDAREVS